MAAINTIIFDLGNVLIDWNPRHVYNETYFDTLEKRDYFFSDICTMDWNEQQDAGYGKVFDLNGFCSRGDDRHYPAEYSPARAPIRGKLRELRDQVADA